MVQRPAPHADPGTFGRSAPGNGRHIHTATTSTKWSRIRTRDLSVNPLLNALDCVLRAAFNHICDQYTV